MTTTALRAAVTGDVAVADKPTTFPAMLQAYKAQIAAALPRHLNADRMARIALTCFRQNPQLAECKPASVFAAVIQSSQLGLEPGLNGRAYIIPYKGEATFVPGWKGLVELVNRTGRATCWTGAVFDGDKFEYRLGDSPMVEHRPGSEDDPSRLLYTYAVGRVNGSSWPIIEVWPVARTLKHRDRYNKVGRRHYSYENWEMYARKVPLMQVLKYLPSSPELEAAIALNTDAERGAQRLNIDDAIAGTFSPSTSDDDRKPGPVDAERLIETMRGRKDVDTLDVDATLIESIADDGQRESARAAYQKRRAELVP